MQQTEILIPIKQNNAVNEISFEKMKLLTELNTLKTKEKKDSETARYLAGKKKGAWGRNTYADEKRYNKLSNLRTSIKLLEMRINNIN